MKEIIAEMRKIRSDNRSGATTLTAGMVMLFERMLDEHKPSQALRRFHNYAGQFIDSHPTMAQVINLCRDVIEQADDLVSLRILLDDWNGALKRQTAATANAAVEIAGRYGRILTLSNSSLVALAVGQLGTRTRVVIGEGRPVNEGLILARSLKEQKVDVTVVVDAALAGMVQDMDLALVGCDCLTQDFLVNKVGTLPLALACARARVPFVVLCPSTKYLRRDRSVYFQIADHPADQVHRNLTGIRIVNRYFETVPPDLISQVVFEHGACAPKSFIERMENATR